MSSVLHILLIISSYHVIFYETDDQVHMVLQSSARVNRIRHIRQRTNQQSQVTCSRSIVHVPQARANAAFQSRAAFQSLAPSQFPPASKNMQRLADGLKAFTTRKHTSIGWEYPSKFRTQSNQPLPRSTLSIAASLAFTPRQKAHHRLFRVDSRKKSHVYCLRFPRKVERKVVEIRRSLKFECKFNS
jgi:hypothetical protein